MFLSDFDDKNNEPVSRRFYSSTAWYIITGVLIGALLFLVFSVLRHKRKDVKAVEVEWVAKPPLSPFSGLVFPTALDLLGETNRARVFQPTVSGRLESALWGSTRTGSDLKARFHAAVDIAAARRDRSGKPLDEVRAVADGTVEHVAGSAGGSSFGRYVVVRHDDPLGPVYSWYAHLGSIEKGITPGVSVNAATPLGVIGNSASYRIPLSRAHLHFEICLMLNDRFAQWARENGIRPDRGNFNGWNFRSVDPLDVYTAQKSDPGFNFIAYLRSVPSAFALVLAVDKLPEYFSRYPKLWVGETVSGGTIVLHGSEGGLILKGRGAHKDERKILSAAGGRAAVLWVAEDVLGRNGLRIVEKHGSGWKVGRGAERWLNILTY